MAVERTGNVYTGSQSSDQSIAVTIPEDAEACVVFVAGYRPNSPNAVPDDISWDNGGSRDFQSIDCAHYNFQGADDGQLEALVMYDDDPNWPGPGSRSLRVELPAYSEGAHKIIAFYKGMDRDDPIIDTHTQDSGGSNALYRSALDGVGENDLSIAGAYCYSGSGGGRAYTSGDFTRNSQTLVAVLGNFNNISAGVAEKYGEDVMEVCATSQNIVTCIGVSFAFRAAEVAEPEEADFSAASDFASAFTGVIATSATLTAGVSAGHAISGMAAAVADISSGVSAGHAFSGRASAFAAITESLSAGDTDGAIRAAEAAISAEIDADAQYQSVAAALAAIQAGLEAGEEWAAIAAAEAVITADAEFGATFSGDIQATQAAALAAGTQAAAEFLGAVAAYGLLVSGASASDAFAASASVVGAFTAAASAGATFAIFSGVSGSISAAIAVQEAFNAAASTIGSVSAAVDVDGAFSSIAAVAAAVSFGVALGATFVAQSSSDVSIIGATASLSDSTMVASVSDGHMEATVEAIGSMVASVRAIRGMRATVRNLLAKKSSIN